MPLTSCACHVTVEACEVASAPRRWTEESDSESAGPHQVRDSIADSLLRKHSPVYLADPFDL